jgi:hypothetical protein
MVPAAAVRRGYPGECCGLAPLGLGQFRSMKKLLEVLVCFIHPLAVVLGWINVAGRSDLNAVQKLVWAVFLIVPIVPFVYVLTGGDLW